MAKPNSRATLIQYCKRALGHPVIEINVDDDQVDDRVDEALQFYQEYHTDAVEKVYLKHLVTPTDQTNGYISVPDLVTNVVRVMPLRDNSGSSQINMFDVKYQMFLNDIYSLGFLGTMVDYKMTMNHLALLDMLIDPDDKHIDFNRHRNTLRINMDWSEETDAVAPQTVTVTVVSTSAGNQFRFNGSEILNISKGVTYTFNNSAQGVHPLKFSETENGSHAGGSEYTTGISVSGDTVTFQVAEDAPDKLYSYCPNHSAMGAEHNLQIDSTYLVLECYRILDPNTYTDVYNDYYLKRYTTALIKLQWGTNLMKFEGMQMPGGVTFNGRQIFDDATQELEKLNEEARLNWEEPVDFYTG